MTQLESLDVSYNKLAVPPNNLDQLTNLESISLRANNIDSLPENFNEMSNIKHIDIADNNFSTYPECFYSMKHPVNLDINYNDKITTITPGMRMLMNEYGWTMTHEPDYNSYLTCAINYHSDINTIPVEEGKAILLRNSFDDKDRVTMKNESPLETEAQRSLTKAFNSREEPRSQEDFLTDVENCPAQNKRIITTKHGSINIFGCGASISDSKEGLDFVYNHVTSAVFLFARNEFEADAKFIINCSGDKTYRPTKVKSMPIMDFSTPRLEHCETVLKEIKEIKSTPSNRPKTLMLSCAEGEGRTGSMMSFVKLVDNFKQLNESEQMRHMTLTRDSTLNNDKGVFKQLEDDFKTTKFVANTINEIR